MTLDGRHTYWAEVGSKPKVKVIGTTSVSGLLDKPGLKFWAVNLACDLIKSLVEGGKDVTLKDIDEARNAHRQTLQEAAESGTAVHLWAEEWIKAGLAGKEAPKPPEDDKIVNGALAFMRWATEHKVKFVSSERLVYSVKHGFGGTMDAEAIVDGKLRVIDFKTSKAKKPQKGKEEEKCVLCGKVGCGGVYDEYRFQTAAYQLAAEEEGSKYDGERLIVRFDKENAEFSVHEIDGFKKDAKAFLGLLAAKKRLNEIA